MLQRALDHHFPRGGVGDDDARSSLSLSMIMPWEA